MRWNFSLIKTRKLKPYFHKKSRADFSAEQKLSPIETAQSFKEGRIKIKRLQWAGELLAASLHIEIKVGNINVNRCPLLPPSPFLEGWKGVGRGHFLSGRVDRGPVLILIILRRETPESYGPKESFECCLILYFSGTVIY